MLITCHWSASPPVPLTDYHVEFALNRPIPSDIDAKVTHGLPLTPADVDRLKTAFDVWKFMDFAAIPQYAVWHLNHDPRDDSVDISIAALCMGGEHVATVGPWGRWPFTRAHAYIMAAIVARIATLKQIDVYDSFPVAGSLVGRLQNGPVYVVSTHGFRAYQTPNPGVAHPERGYFMFSGDPDMRWDLSALEVGEADALANFDSALGSAAASAAWLRDAAHRLKAAGISDFWGLEKESVPVPA
jgi:hypothetical protein